ncbi:hypothetical protein G5I_03343 [Acromyrmex echinatior]|uniref:Uncharacterized protein n=1 Tax=Acromyrmex echinatior TaxID=103372 RepID=F4WCR7_ACREC|nr:hypothetical protein G5I_03343 [Acromyrmex echinatior]
MGKNPDCFNVTHSRVSERTSIAEGIAVGRVGGVRRKTAGYTVCCPLLADLYETPLTPKHTSSSFGAPLEKPVCSAATITIAIASFREILLYNTILYCVIPSNFACLDLTRLARGLTSRIREGPAKGPLGMAANYAESDVEEEEEEEDDGNDNEVDEEEEEEEEERSGSSIYEERLLVVGQNVGEEPRECVQREERREETRRDGLFFLRVGLCVVSAPCSRSNLEAGSQKLPVPVESAWSWIILPKGIFIGRECMQKRGHRHKEAAPADLALTQLREWTHDFVPATFDSQLEQTPRNSLAVALGNCAVDDFAVYERGGTPNRALRNFSKRGFLERTMQMPFNVKGPYAGK